MSNQSTERVISLLIEIMELTGWKMALGRGSNSEVILGVSLGNAAYIEAVKKIQEPVPDNVTWN